MPRERDVAVVERRDVVVAVVPVCVVRRRQRGIIAALAVYDAPSLVTSVSIVTALSWTRTDGARVSGGSTAAMAIAPTERVVVAIYVLIVV